MHLSNSTITQKGQATIPIEIRNELDLQPGDKIVFEIIREGEVVIKKLKPFDYDYHRNLSNTLSEWNSKEDDEAFDDL